MAGSVGKGAAGLFKKGTNMTDVYLKNHLNRPLDLIENNGSTLVVANTRAQGSDSPAPFSVPKSMVVGPATRDKMLARRKRGKIRDKRNRKLTKQWGNHCG